MGKQGKTGKKTRKFAAVKRMLNPNDARLRSVQEKAKRAEEEKKAKEVRHVCVSVSSTLEKKAALEVASRAPPPSSMFLSHNQALAPPYRVIIDTNFINLSLENRIEVIRGMMDALFAKCIPCVSDCVMAELEKLGPRYRLALQMARDDRFERLPCTHNGTYADDCIVQRVTAHRCYIVATCDKQLKRRLRKVPGVPLMTIAKRRYAIERLPDQGIPM